MKSNEIKGESDHRDAFNCALKYLSYKMRTEWEITRYLRKKGYPGPAIDQTVEKLRGYNYIDDDAYMEMYISTRKRDGYARKKILYNLTEKGISENKAIQAIDSLYSHEEEIGVVNEKTIKLLERYRAFPYRDKVAKISRSLLSKGFKREDVDKVLRELLSDESKPGEYFERLEKLAEKYKSKYEKKGYSHNAVTRKTAEALYRRGYDLDDVYQVLKGEEY